MDTVVEKLLTYALGRGLDYPDAPTVRQIVREIAQDGYRWSALIKAVVSSTPFQMRAAADGAAAQTPAAVADSDRGSDNR